MLIKLVTFGSPAMQATTFPTTGSLASGLDHTHTTPDHCLANNIRSTLCIKLHLSALAGLLLSYLSER